MHRAVCPSKVVLAFILPMMGCKASSSPAPTPTLPDASSAARTSPKTVVARETDTVATIHGDLRITPIQHATLLLEIAGHAIYVDPVGGANYEGLPKAAAIFITDIHSDHMAPAGINSVSVPGETVLVAPPAVAEQLAKAMPGMIPRVTIMEPGQATGAKTAMVPSIGFWFGVETVPMYNRTRGPSRGKLYHDKGRGNGYVFSFGDTRVYVSGDTECTSEMKALTNIDVAFVCMNLPYTMPPAEAAECVRAFRPKVLYPYHYRGSDLAELDRALAGDSGIEVRKRRWY